MALPFVSLQAFFSCLIDKTAQDDLGCVAILSEDEEEGLLWL